LEALQKARQATLRSFFTQHNCRREELIEQRLEQIRQAIPAIRDAAVIQAAVAMVSVLVALIATLRQGIAALDRQIEQAALAHPDFAIFDSFPGAGPVLAPRLLAAFGSQRDRYQSAAEIQQFRRIAPVLVRSGKTAWVHYRWACPKFLRQTFQEWAGHSIGFCDWARAYYEQQPRCRPPRRRASARLQVDSNRLSMLERPGPLRRFPLPPKPSPAHFAAGRPLNTNLIMKPLTGTTQMTARALAAPNERS